MCCRARHALAMLLGLTSCAASALDLNQATEAELDSLRGLGPSLTAKVLAARAAQNFQSWADLMQRVHGIREATARRLADQGVTIQGHTFAAKAPVHKAP